MRTLLAAVAAAAVAGALTAATPAPDHDLWLADHLARTTSGQHALADLRVFERIADQNGGQRATATPGFAASARYVTDQLTAAGYKVKSQTVPYRQFRPTLAACEFVITPPRPDQLPFPNIREYNQP